MHRTIKRSVAGDEKFFRAQAKNAIFRETPRAWITVPELCHPEPRRRRIVSDILLRAT